MARKVVVQLIDDLDGTAVENVETVRFSLDGVVYAIDLKPDNAARLRDSLAEFVAHARRAGRKVGNGRRTVGETRTREQSQAIREWARAHGHDLAKRGRIPLHVIEEFDKVHRR